MSKKNVIPTEQDFSCHTDQGSKATAWSVSQKVIIAVKIDKEIHSTTANAYARYDKGGWRYALLGITSIPNSKLNGITKTVFKHKKAR